MDCFRISVPEDLRRYQADFDYGSICGSQQNICCNEYFNVKIFKNPDSEIEYVAYLSDDNELIKKVYYSGSNIIQKDMYRNEVITVSEKYEAGHIVSRTNFNKTGEKKSEVLYEYNKKNLIVSILKINTIHQYQILYGYDELSRVNSRKILLDGTVVQEQKFRFDILDRVVEYKDNNQRVIVEKSDNECGLISYKITDKLGNEIYINNYFIGKKYKETHITLNGHSTILENMSYTDNVMLKKPYTTEDDLDLVIANILNPVDVTTCRTTDTDILPEVLKLKLKTNVLPISMRKMALYNIAMKI